MFCVAVKKKSLSSSDQLSGRLVDGGGGGIGAVGTLESENRFTIASTAIDIAIAAPNSAGDRPNGSTYLKGLLST